MKIAVTGGTGTVGRFVIDFLAKQSHELVVATRQSVVPEGFGVESVRDHLRWFIGDMEDPAFASNFLQSCDALVHCGFAHLPGKYRGGEGENPSRFWQQNFVSSVRLLDAARELGVRRIVLLSSRAVFDGYDSEIPLADDAPPRPTTHYGLLNAAKEQLARVYSDLEIVSIRSTGVYGLTWPPERSKWCKLVANARLGRRDAPLSNRGKTEVHGHDLAAAIHLLLTSSKHDLAHFTYNCSDIVVSDRFVYETTRTILEGAENPDNIELAQPLPARNQMGTDALTALGWCGGGVARLHSTIQSMLTLLD